MKWDGCVEGVYVRNDTDHELTPVALYSVPTVCCGLPLLFQPLVNKEMGTTTMDGLSSPKCGPDVRRLTKRDDDDDPNLVSHAICMVS